MKLLRIYTVAADASNLDIIKSIVIEIGNIDFAYETDIEEAINAFCQQSFDLLIIDKAINTADYNKLYKIAELLHPDAALITLHLTDQDFIRHKLTELMAKWKDTQTDEPRHFFDNPQMN